jgi:phage terminase large subunit-like protein
MTATATAPAPRIGTLDPEVWRKWDAKSKDRFLNALEASERKKQVWYCMKGRTCDGQPHDQYDYGHARGDQWPPPGTKWLVWLLKGGRGSGKTRSGAEWIRNMSKTMERTSIIGPSWSHVRDTMIEGDSGLLFVFDLAKETVIWEPSKRKLTVPCRCKKTKYGKAPHRKGHFIQAFTGEEPERLRGPQHAAVWLDEPAHFALIDATWDNMMFGLRLGQRPVVLCSTTPLPTKWMKTLIKEPDTVSVTVSTFANIKNLAPTFRKVMLAKYDNTRLGRQELYGEVLEDIVGALWTRSMIDDFRVERIMEGEGETAVGRPALTHEDMERVIVAIDPAGSSDRKRDETGIVVVGKKGDHFYVIDDLSGHYTPNGWGQAAWAAYDKYEADKIVAEKNYGGEMVLSTLKNVRAEGKVELVHSRRGKVLRAEPIVSLYEQERVHHFSRFDELETQMTEWVPAKDDSPDRVDALVHGMTDLAELEAPTAIAVPKRSGQAITAGYGSGLGMGMGVGTPTPYGAPMGAMFGYTPRDEEIVESARQTIERLEKILSTQPVYMPSRMPCDEGSHPASFEPEGMDGTQLCSRCLHEVEDDEGVLVRKKGESQLAMSV